MRERGEGKKKETSSLKGQWPFSSSLSLSVRLFPSRPVKKPCLIWVELLHAEERQQPGSVGLVSRNSPNTFATSLLLQSVSKAARERMHKEGGRIREGRGA